MIINHNISSMNANRMLSFKGLEVDSGIQKLSSGMRINTAGDDASGLAVSEKMRSQIGGLRSAMRNTEDAISFIQTAEGYLQETQDILQRIRELAIQSSNGIYSSEDRMQIQVEVSQLVAEVDRIASHAQFNGLNMLTGRFAQPSGEAQPAASMWFHIGANAGQRIRAFIGTMTATGLKVIDVASKAAVSISSPEKANQTIAVVDEALRKVSKQRADLGAYQNRIGKVVEGLAISAENLQAAESRIRDTNMAEEMSDFVKNQILTQASISMLAQANMKPNSVLKLLG
ncbi:MAG: flagellin [Spirochaetes bacterium GWF1_41_5]|nr:MAG: flagellin [Spirochaetes bacterium GWF1_41_5]HBE03393.1 flagellin [Spirochaetia bacterium]